MASFLADCHARLTVSSTLPALNGLNPLNGLPDIVHAGVAGDHHDDNLGVPGFDHLQGCKATDLGHQDI